MTIKASYHQERLWFIDRFEAGNLYEANPVYHNIPLILKIRGDVDILILEQSIRQAIRRHEALRTRIVTLDGEPLQVVESTVDFNLQTAGCRGAPEPSKAETEDDDEAAIERAIQWSRQPLPLDGDSLIRGLFMPLGEKKAVLALCLHHVIADRYSLSILTRDIFTIYSALSRNTTPRLSELSLHYADFSRWQQDLPAEAVEKLFFYWRQQLSGGLPVLELPTDSPRPPIHVFREGRIRFELSASLSGDLDRYGRRRGLSGYTLLLGAFKILLHKYSRQGDIRVGTPVDNRQQAGLEHVVGPVANLLVVRSQIEGASPAEQYLMELHSVMEGARPYRQMPFDLLVAMLNPRKDMSRTALFDVLFHYDDRPLESLAVDDLEIEVEETNLGWGKYDLNLLLRRGRSTVKGVMVYNEEYFRSATLQRLLSHYRALLAGMLTEPQQPIHRLNLLNEGEKRQLLEVFDRRGIGYPRRAGIHGLFEEQTGKKPGAVALVASGQLSYGELNRLAAELAGRLRSEGVKPASLVAVSIEPSSDLIVGILAILKAGGAYLPVDPEYPRERIDFILADSAAGAVLSRQGSPDELSLRIQSASPGGAAAEDLPSRLAYVIYTSGSTGRPKGSMVEHGNVVRLLFNDDFPFDFANRDIWTLFHSCCFDFSVWEMYGALLYGGKLVMVPRLTARCLTDYLKLLKRETVTVLNQTPVVFHSLTAEEIRHRDHQLALRYVIFGGEALLPAALKGWKSKYPETRLINMYGITETTVHVTYKEITPEDIEFNISNIGRPIPTLAIYVTDENLRLLPPGVAGELCVGGLGVCRGYLNRPELSAARFVDNPYTAEERIYRSGDLVRMSENGDMEYLGRIDLQVKIRGFRIELAEIEVHLLKHEAVGEAVVVSRNEPGGAGEQYLCAYVVPASPPSGGETLRSGELRRYLARRLPEYMIPAYFVELKALPLTANGKIDRRALPAPEVETAASFTPPQNEIEKLLVSVWARELDVDPARIGRQTSFFEIGGNSLKITRITSRLEELLGREVEAVSMFEFPTIRELAGFLSGEPADVDNESIDKEEPEAPPQPTASEKRAVAVVGMAGRFPGARNIEQFWQNLEQGRESIAFFGPRELTEAGVEAVVPGTSAHVGAFGILPEREFFDCTFFDLPPADADLLDPQVRIFLECVWEALESAGCDPDSYPGSIGVFAGGGHRFDWEARCRWSGKNDRLGEWAAEKLNNIDYLATRTAYHLNLKGPAVSVQTACSTSLVAVHLACRALRSRECRLAVAGGVDLAGSGRSGYLYQEGMILSADGHCRAFDAAASGTVGGEGAAVVVLKMLDRAVAEGDTLRGLIRGSAVNNDGRVKVGFTAPGVEGQRGVVRSALRDAELEPESIDYIETHGTGTRLGDPLEIEALKPLFQNRRRETCYIGAVKTNIGHLGIAAGAAGLIKTLLALRHGKIPASLHFERPNPAIDFREGPFRVNSGLQAWPGRSGRPRRAGISSFGIGGTNAHVIVEEPPGELNGEATVRSTPCPQLIVLSARTEPALDRMTANLAAFFRDNPGIRLEDAAFTLQAGRKAFPCRRLAVCSSVEEAAQHLAAVDAKHVHADVAAPAKIPVIFMFPGQGSQYVNMGVDLYQEEPVFRQEMESCFEILASLGRGELRSVLYPGDGRPAGGEVVSLLDRTEFAQPLLFAFEYALARLLMHWGIDPDAMIGHSLGEYTAACLAGVFSLADALHLVVERGRRMQAMPEGAMLSVSLGEAELTPLLGGSLALAAVNGAGRCVISGPTEAVDTLAAQLERRDVRCSRLHTSHAFHSAMMDPVVTDFEALIEGIELNEPHLPFISNLTGKIISPRQAQSPRYWTGQLRRPVRFFRGLQELLKEDGAFMLEVGPGSSLTTFARQFPDSPSGTRVVNLVRHPRERAADRRCLLEGIGRLWAAGLAVDWHRLHGKQKRRRLPLPTYPFERIPFTVDVKPAEIVPAAAAGGSGLEKRVDPADWFYVPTWKRQPLVPRKKGATDTETGWLLFTESDGLGRRLVEALRSQGRPVTVVRPGDGFVRLEGNEFTIRPGAQADVEALFSELENRSPWPRRIVHLWGTAPLPPPERGKRFVPDRIEKHLEEEFYTPVQIARALGRRSAPARLTLTVVTDRMQSVSGDESLCPERAVALGPVQVIPLEYDHIDCRSIDLELRHPKGDAARRLVDRLLAELEEEPDDRIVAYRGCHRWVRSFSPVRLAAADGGPALLKERGVYLVSGGLGGIGLELAHHLARRYRAGLILTGRSPFPPRAEWPRWLDNSSGDPETGATIRRLLAMEAAGGRLLVCRADVADYSAMEAVVKRARQEFGPVNGVIHAAGVADGGIIQLRERELSEGVLAPKVHGTRVLMELLEKDQPDFILFCSSLDAVLPDIGQVAYAAANSFLDAAANAALFDRRTRFMSLNWDAWQEKGMAARADGSERREIRHPFFCYYCRPQPHQRVYSANLRLGEHWFLDEHRVDGRATVPGTAYLEIALSVLDDPQKQPDRGVEIRDFYFLTPLAVAEAEERIVHARLTRKGEDAEFSIASRPAAGCGEWLEHARGVMRLLDRGPGEPPRLDELMNRFPGEAIKPAAGPTEAAGAVRVGPHWNNLAWWKCRETEGLARLELPETFHSDLDRFRLHPALLDNAATFLLDGREDPTTYLPFSIKRMEVWGPLPSTIYSLMTDITGAGTRVREFNIRIMDREGRDLVSMERFLLRPLSQTALPEARSYTPDMDGRHRPGPHHLLSRGLLPAEGVDVFGRVLASDLPQVLVSCVDIRRRKARQEESPQANQTAGAVPATAAALPRPRLSSRYVEPESPTQHMLAGIWQETLGIGRVGLHDDFFELGGDSLLAVTMLPRINRRLNVEIPPAAFFNAPTIRELETYIDGSSLPGGEQPPVPHAEERSFYALSSAQKRLYILQQMYRDNLFYNLPEARIMEGRPHLDRLEAAFRSLIDRHDSLRTGFGLWEMEPGQVLHPVADFNLVYREETAIPSRDGPGINRLIETFVKPFDLTRPPLLRSQVVRLAEGDYLWLFDIHHVVADAVGVTVVQQELQALYRGETLPPLRFQYKDFSRWHNRLLETGHIEEQEAYWLDLFAGGIPRLNLPTDYPRPDKSGFSGDQCYFQLEAETAAAFRKMAARGGTTLFVNLLAALNVLLFKYTGQEDIVVGTAVDGRTRPEFREVVGMFINILPLRNYPREEMAYPEFLGQVRANVVKAFENQDMPFDRLVERLNLSRGSSGNPVFDVCFNFVHYVQPVLDLDGLKCVPYLYETRTSTFDLLLWADDRGAEIRFMLSYSSELFRRETVETLGRRYIEIIRQLVKNSETRLKDIPLSHQFRSLETNIFRQEPGDFTF